MILKKLNLDLSKSFVYRIKRCKVYKTNHFNILSYNLPRQPNMNFLLIISK